MQNNPINNELHERLCAFLFDELEGADRAAFELELAASPALAAEKSRIEASMQLVKEFAPVAPVALSPGMRAGLVAAAQKSGAGSGSTRGPILAWYRHPGLQVAAATVLAFIAFRALDERMLENAATGEYATREQSASRDSRSKTQATPPDATRLNRLQSVTDSGPASKSSTPNPKGQFLSDKVPGFFEARPVDRADAGGLEELESMGYLGYEESNEASTTDLAGQLPALQNQVAKVEQVQGAGTELERRAKVGSPGGTYRGPGDSAATIGGGGGPGIVMAPVSPEAIYTARFGASPVMAIDLRGVSSPEPSGGLSADSTPLQSDKDEESRSGAENTFDSVLRFNHGSIAANNKETGASIVHLPEDVQAPATVTKAAVESAKEELARYEVDAKARKSAALSGDVGLISAELAGLNSTLSAVESEGTSSWFLGRGESSPLGRSPQAKKTEGIVTVTRAGGGGGAGGDATDSAVFDLKYGMIPEEENEDLLAGLELRLADGSVDMPAARARLAQLEEAEILAKVDSRVEAENELRGLTEAERTALGTLRSFVEDVDQAELRAERDRLQEQHRRAIEVEREYLTILQDCVPRADEKPSAMYYRYWGDNGYEFAIHDALSTFAADVDTASYTLARRYLQDGYLPERAQIRTEEFVNYATPDLAPPTNGDIFSVSMELAPSPFGPIAEDGGTHQMLRVGVRGMEVDKSDRDPVALTFVVDVSGSMETDDRLELVKHSLRLLVGELNPTDSIALITFNTTATRVLDMTSVGSGAAIERALYEMKTGGGTNAEAGLTLGFAEAVMAHTKGAQNRVVFLSDGVGNIGETNENQLLEDARRAREKGIYLNTIGFGMTNHNDRFLEQLADGGDGLCNYVDSSDEAKRALVDNFTGAFQTIARDVKIQVEFDKNQVLSYRQLGYENRAIADSDFRNDKVDAGEIGAGHQVVALYEIVLGEAWTETRKAPLAIARVRYKAPYGELVEGAEDKAREIASSFYYGESAGKFSEASIGFQKSALAAQFAEFLRRSSHTKGDSVSLLRYRLEELAKATNDPELIELSALVQLAQPQLESALLVENQTRQSADELQRFEYECLSHAYIYDATTEEWLAKTRATRTHLREQLRREVYSAYGLED